MNKHFPSEIPKAQPKATSKKDIYTTMTKQVWRYQRGDQKPKWSKGQRTIYNNITQKANDRARRTSLKTIGEFMCSGRVIQLLLHMWHPTSNGQQKYCFFPAYSNVMLSRSNSFCFNFCRGITERVWISLSCKPLSEPCKWGDGELLGWSEWRTAQEPIYECGVLDYYNSGFPNWISRKCPDRYRSLCTGKYIYLLFIYSVNSNFNIHTCISFVYRIKQRMPHYRNSSKRIKQRMPHYRNISKIQWNNGRKR
jgi:hypothetical protein